LNGTRQAVFVSYASQDAEVAGRICEALRAAGIEVWFDKSELRGGDAWDQRIRQQIRDCTLFLPIISLSTQARAEGYFRLEWRIADQRTQHMGRSRAFLVPICADATSEKDADVPDSFSAVQWTRLPAGIPTQEFVARVGKLLDQPATGGVTARTPQVALSQEPLSPRRWRIGVAMAVVMAAAAIAFYFSVGSHHEVVSSSQKPAIETARIVPSAILEKSIAVLPFIDMSEKKGREYLAEGLSEELIDRLASIPDSRVTARTSSFSFKGKDVPIADVAKSLNVRYVLEGSVRESGNRLRVTTQLIEAEHGLHLWSQTYDRDSRDVFAVQDEIVRAVAQALQIALYKTIPLDASPRRLTAHRLYLEGRFFLDEPSKENNDRAIAAYRSAIAADPTFAVAWAGLASALSDQSDEYADNAANAHVAARDAAEHAIAADPSVADGYTALAQLLLTFDWDWAGAAAMIAKAKALEPTAFTILNTEFEQSRVLGDWRQAIAIGRQAVARDPLSSGWRQQLALALMCSGQPQGSEAELRRALDLKPDSAGPLFLLSQALWLQGRRDDALSVAQKEPLAPYRLWLLALINGSEHRKASDASLTEFKRLMPTESEDSIAWIHAYRGELDQAFEWFDRAYSLHLYGMTDLKCRRAEVAFFRDPRYKALLRKMKLPE
jgi:TolB-like protein/tetratricopeptide (TPR) repeat protein